MLVSAIRRCGLGVDVRVAEQNVDESLGFTADSTVVQVHLPCSQEAFTLGQHLPTLGLD